MVSPKGRELSHEFIRNTSKIHPAMLRRKNIEGWQRLSGDQSMCQWIANYRFQQDFIRTSRVVGAVEILLIHQVSFLFVCF